MFERFTERARQVVGEALSAAREADRDRIDSVAILLGLLREREGLAARVLAELGIQEGTVRGAWEDVPTEAAPARQEGPQLPFTHQAKAVLEMALREALSLGHNYIGTEHILLGLARRCECEAAAYLADSGVSSERIRRAVIHHLSGSRAPKAPAEPQAYRTLASVPPDLIDMAADLTRIVRDTSGTASFDRGLERVQVSRDARGIAVSFLTRKPEGS